MNTLARWVPRLIIITAVLHFIWAFAQPHAWTAIMKDGFFRAAGDTEVSDYFAREASIWFMTCGVTLLALGTMTQHVLNTTKRLPAQIGWYLLLLGIPLTLVYFPVSGGWALIAIGVLSLIVTYRSKKETTDSHQ